MRRLNRIVICTITALLLKSTAYAQDENFSQWLEKFRTMALAQGISPQTLEDAFDGIEPDESVVELDRKQPENKLTLERYLRNVINQRRIDKGKEMLVEHAELLEQISKRYGVQPKFIVALWAIESDFGNHKGNFSVIQSLTTLAYEGRRADFFTKELISALKILEAEAIPADELSGSWAGAMGDCQFMPSTFLRYAADGDGDGRRDIWNSTADVFASIANYLHALGWKGDRGWGGPATLPEGFDPSYVSIDHPKTGQFWRAKGVLLGRNGKTIRPTQPPMYVIYVGSDDKNAYLVTENFKTLLNWNRSRYFATAVGVLSDAIGE